MPFSRHGKDAAEAGYWRKLELEGAGGLAVLLQQERSEQPGAYKRDNERERHGNLHDSLAP
jgi:hypothetical protein